MWPSRQPQAHLTHSARAPYRCGMLLLQLLLHPLVLHLLLLACAAQHAHAALEAVVSAQQQLDLVLLVVQQVLHLLHARVPRRRQYLHGCLQPLVQLVHRLDARTLSAAGTEQCIMQSGPAVCAQADVTHGRSARTHLAIRRACIIGVEGCDGTISRTVAGWLLLVLLRLRASRLVLVSKALAGQQAGSWLQLSSARMLHAGRRNCISSSPAQQADGGCSR